MIDFELNMQSAKLVIILFLLNLLSLVDVAVDDCQVKLYNGSKVVEKNRLLKLKYFLELYRAKWLYLILKIQLLAFFGPNL